MPDCIDTFSELRPFEAATVWLFRGALRAKRGNEPRLHPVRLGRLGEDAYNRFLHTAVPLDLREEASHRRASSCGFLFCHWIQGVGSNSSFRAFCANRPSHQTSRTVAPSPLHSKIRPAMPALGRPLSKSETSCMMEPR